MTKEQYQARRAELTHEYELYRLPGHMWEGVLNYLQHGIITGSFLTAVMEDRLVESFGRADEINLSAMSDWVDWLYNVCPSEARGSVEKVAAWKANGGLDGRNGE